MHDGCIWVESEIDKDSTFAFTLPVRVDQGSGMPHPRARHAEPLRAHQPASTENERMKS